MTRTNKGSKGPGYDFMGRRPKSLDCGHGKIIKTISKRIERARSKSSTGKLLARVQSASRSVAECRGVVEVNQDCHDCSYPVLFRFLDIPNRQTMYRSCWKCGATNVLRWKFDLLEVEDESPKREAF